MNKQNCHITVQHILSVEKRAGSFSHCVLVTLNVKDDDDDNIIRLHSNNTVTKGLHFDRNSLIR